MLDSPDDTWCSYSFPDKNNESGSETTDFCDTPTEIYYTEGSVRELAVAGTIFSPVQDISTITGTPAITEQG